MNAYAIEDEWESSNDSGASISQLNMYCNVTILSSDNPNGIFQVMSYVPNTAEYIPVRKKYGYHDVDEEIGTLDLFIVRAQGTDGRLDSICFTHCQVHFCGQCQNCLFIV